MELIGKVSKGSRMDQIYIPKNRSGFGIGNYVVIKPVEDENEIKTYANKFYFYSVRGIEPIKIKIISEVMQIICNFFNKYENIFIIGSFLDKGFSFNDMDILIITEEKISSDLINKDIERKLGIKTHIILMSNKEFIQGLGTDPLYQMALSKCISKNRFLYNIPHIINYKLLDLHLLKSKTLIDNFDILSGNEKYNLVRNAIAISLYLNSKKISREAVDNEIKKRFGIIPKKGRLLITTIQKDSFSSLYFLINFPFASA